MTNFPETGEYVHVMRRVVDTVTSQRRDDLEPTAGQADWRHRLMTLGHDPLSRPDHWRHDVAAPASAWHHAARRSARAASGWQQESGRPLIKGPARFAAGSARR